MPEKVVCFDVSEPEEVDEILASMDDTIMLIMNEDDEVSMKEYLEELHRLYPENSKRNENANLGGEKITRNEEHCADTSKPLSEKKQQPLQHKMRGRRLRASNLRHGAKMYRRVKQI